MPVITRRSTRDSTRASHAAARRVVGMTSSCDAEHNQFSTKRAREMLRAARGEVKAPGGHSKLLKKKKKNKKRRHAAATYNGWIMEKKLAMVERKLDLVLSLALQEYDPPRPLSPPPSPEIGRRDGLFGGNPWLVDSPAPPQPPSPPPIGAVAPPMALETPPTTVNFTTGRDAPKKPKARLVRATVDMKPEVITFPSTDEEEPTTEVDEDLCATPTASAPPVKQEPVVSGNYSPISPVFPKS